ncbi:MAG: hypothetical protein HAW61_01185, partial [Candidatus Portiera sp.]|nr:hypothetical protein [Portiera sp.]
MVRWNKRGLLLLVILLVVACDSNIYSNRFGGGQRSPSPTPSPTNVLSVSELEAVSTRFAEASISWRNPVHEVNLSSITIYYYGYETLTSSDPIDGVTDMILLNATNGSEYLVMNSTVNHKII